jgi:excisionase family DNA binding protein
MRLITQQAAAELLGCSDRSIRNLIARGTLTGWRLPGFRAVRIDRDELLSRLKAIPTATGRREFVCGPTPFNGNVQTTPPGAVVVVEAVDENAGAEG